MFKRLHATVAAVKDVNAATQLYRDLFGLEATPPEVLPELGVKRTVFPLEGGTYFELAEPLSSNRAMARHLERKGEGIYLVSFEVSNLDKHVADLRQKGVEVNVPQGPPSAFMLLGEPHRIAFVHPRFTRGVLIDLVEPQV
ncbi:VOC family protein [Thermodesulfobacteriota bacterium]